MQSYAALLLHTHITHTPHTHTHPHTQHARTHARTHAYTHTHTHTQHTHTHTHTTMGYCSRSTNSSSLSFKPLSPSGSSSVPTELLEGSFWNLSHCWPDPKMHQRTRDEGEEVWCGRCVRGRALARVETINWIGYESNSLSRPTKSV